MYMKLKLSEGSSRKELQPLSMAKLSQFTSKGYILEVGGGLFLAMRILEKNK